MSQKQMTEAEINEYHEAQLLVLKYKEDMREVMAKKPHWSTAPEKATALALSVVSGKEFGVWKWLNDTPGVGYVFTEKRPIEFVNRI